MGWNGLFTWAFISSEMRAKTFNKTFTVVQISNSLHPRFPPSGKLKGRPPCPSSHFFPPRFPCHHANHVKAGLLGALERLLPVGTTSSVLASPCEKSVSNTILYFLWNEIFILFLGLLHFPFLKSRKIRQIRLLNILV